MTESIGQVIRRLRKEKNLTQEELADQLNVTFQAVSRWENETGLPDISQVVPLARVFDVSTDVLFGVYGIDKIAEKESILDKYDTISDPLESYNYMLNVLEQYPNDILFLRHALVSGATVIYCKLSDNPTKIVENCERIARVLINCSNDPIAISTAHQELATIYNSIGQYNNAKEYTIKLPDTIMQQSKSMREFHFMSKNFDEVMYADCDMFFRLLRNEFTQTALEIGKNYYRNNQFEEAKICFISLIDMIMGLFKEIPAYLCIYDSFIWLAKTYIKLDQNTKVIDTLEMLPQLAEQQKQIVIGDYITSHPLLMPLNCKYTDGYDKHALQQNCLDSLADNIFDNIRAEPRFEKIINSLIQ